MSVFLFYGEDAHFLFVNGMSSLVYFHLIHGTSIADKGLATGLFMGSNRYTYGQQQAYLWVATGILIVSYWQTNDYQQAYLRVATGRLINL